MDADIVPGPAGGGIRGSGQPGEFNNGRIQAGWVTVFILYILYLLWILLSPLWRRGFYAKGAGSPEGGTPAAGAAAGTEAAAAAPEMSQIEAGAGGLDPTDSHAPAGTPAGTLRTKMEGMENAWRDGLLLLFSTTLVIMAGRGYSKSEVALQWITLALLVFWGLSQLVPGRAGWIFDSVLWFPIFALAITMWSLAWFNSPSMRSRFGSEGTPINEAF
ncbi:hypothetical protein HDU85_005026 [Gaertneriomyces sp. JEL0708]|nr:hypothetical protein HDU85_005026 [Gaertneriomyces sp. JEL0708]